MFVLLACVLALTFSSVEAVSTPKWNQLTFDYSPEQLEVLKTLPKPQTKISSDGLSQLTKQVSYLVETAKLSEIDQTILPPYLANAQKDFAWLSYLLTGELTGNLGPVTLWTLQLFIPDATLPSLQESAFDLYTSSLAAVVVSKVASRLHRERMQLANYPIKTGRDLWRPTSPGYVGLDSGSCMTWFLTSSKQFVATPLPEDPEFWKAQCDQIKEEQKNLNGQKVTAVFQWAGLTSIDAGSWEGILTHYLEEKRVPIVPQLYARALLFSALADANAAAFHSKYTYWEMRPSQRNREVKPLIPIPNHPSYPSAHSTISAAAATVLSELFPQNKKQWNNLAEEAGMSRIWGGIHYPIDHQGGLELGRKVGKEALKRAAAE